MDSSVKHFFFVQSALDCTILHIHIQTFSGDNSPGPPAETLSVLQRRHQFPHSLPAFPLFLLYKTTTETDYDK